MLTGSLKEYDTCCVEVTVDKDKKIVRPKQCISPDNISDILRTNGLHVGEIKTQNGLKCDYANG